jgi:hypothetical protein
MELSLMDSVRFQIQKRQPDFHYESGLAQTLKKRDDPQLQSVLVFFSIKAALLILGTDT